MKRRRLTMALAVAMIAVGLAGEAWAATKTVKLTVDNKFAPGNVAVAVGDTVQFVWDGGFHDVKFADGTSSGAPVGDVGATYARTFNAAGSFPYVCTVHEALGMKGTITVSAAGATGGGTTAAQGGTLPLTGPEDDVGSIMALVLIAGGVALYRRSRRMAVR